MKAIFTLSPNALPPMTDLYETISGAVRDGCGFSIVGHSSAGVVLVDTSETQIKVMIADAASYPPVSASAFPAWAVGVKVAVGVVYSYGGSLYQVIQSHTTQADWTPDIVPALFRKFYEPSDKPWPWVQPTGAHDAYVKDAKVTHKGYIWQSTIAANVWEPGSAGAEALWTNLTPPPPPATPEWKTGVAYKIGDEVTYLGKKYRCRQAHTSIQTWNPAAAASLWLLIG